MTRATGALALAIVLVPGLAAAEPWSRARIHALPDSAFAVVEIAPDGRKVRHLPHHDESGAVDLPHPIAPRGPGGHGEGLGPADETHPPRAPLGRQGRAVCRLFHGARRDSLR